jgi:cell division septation protein DedD
VLALAVGVVGFGVATAIYLEQPAAPKPPLAPAVTAPLPAPPNDPTAASLPVPAESPPPTATLSEIEPQAGDSATPSVAAIEPPPAAPAASAAPAAAPAPPPLGAATTPYWVEYGAFIREPDAHRLQQALSRRGLEAVVIPTHGRGGRKLFRVRSAPLGDPAAARQAADTARQTLRLAVLVHRGSPAAAPTRYRVQFAAFAQPQRAAQLSRELRRHGIAASVHRVQRTSGKSLYLVQSAPVRDRDQALALGARGKSLVKSDFLVERYPSRRPASDAPQAPRPPPRPVAASR